MSEWLCGAWLLDGVKPRQDAITDILVKQHHQVTHLASELESFLVFGQSTIVVLTRSTYC